MQVYKLGSHSKRNLLPRNTPNISKFILTGPKGSGKSSVLYQYLCEQKRKGKSVVYLDGNSFFRGRIPYYFEDGYCLKMKQYNEEKVIGIDNINSLLEYTNYTDFKNWTLHALNFKNIVSLLKLPNVVGAESSVFKYPSNTKRVVDTRLYDEIKKVHVPPLSKAELSVIAPSANLNRLLFLTGGVMKEVKKVSTFEKINKFI